jgi:hypothetical protein
MISTKMTALMIATAVLGVGSSPLAAMAQVPVEDEVDTSVEEVIEGIRADVQDILDEGFAAIPNVPDIEDLTCENVQDFIDPFSDITGPLEQFALECQINSPL